MKLLVDVFLRIYPVIKWRMTVYDCITKFYYLLLYSNSLN